jgi:predicted amidohydrolase
MGILICEDFWHVSPPYVLWMDGADVFIFCNASPSRGISTEDKLASSQWIEMVSQAYAGLFTNYVIQVNRVGFEDGIHFGGGSTLIAPDGMELARAPYFDEHLILHTIDLNDLRRTRSQLPLLRDERPHLMLHELNRIISAHGPHGR